MLEKGNCSLSNTSVKPRPFPLDGYKGGDKSVIMAAGSHKIQH